MRIAVVQPPVRDFYLTPHRMSALGARAVAFLCGKAGHDAKIFNFPLEGGRAALPLPLEAGHLAPHLVAGERGPTSFFTSFGRFGPDFGDCAEIIAAWRPDAVFVSSFAYAYAEDALDLAAALRSRLPGVPLAAGGGGPSAEPDTYVASRHGRSFDLVVTGEAEPVLAEILAMLDGRGGRIGSPMIIEARGRDPAGEPTCVFAVTEESGTETRAAVSLTRGCPFACGFCSNRLCHGTAFRTVPMEEVEKGLSLLPANKRLHVDFEDDNLLFDLPYFREVLRLVRKRFPGASFSAENGLDYRLLDPEIADELVSSGFDRFNLSLGTAEAKGAVRQNRKFDLDRYLGVLDAVGRRGVASTTYFIAGLDTDTPDSTADHLRLLAGLPTLAGISLFYPVPGIAGFDPPPQSLLLHPGLARGSFAFPWNGTLSTSELVTAFRLARFVNLEKRKDPPAPWRELRETIRATRRIHTVKKRDGGTEITAVSGLSESLQDRFFA